MDTSSEQQLFKRILRWTLFLGILIGVELVVVGVMVCDFFIASRGGFHIVAQSVDELLVPLLLFLMGSILALQWKVQSLRSRVPTLRASVGRTPDRLQGPLGFLMMGLSGFTLLSWAVGLSSDVAILIVAVGGISALGLILGVELYLKVRRGTQG